VEDCTAVIELEGGDGAVELDVLDDAVTATLEALLLEELLLALCCSVTGIDETPGALVVTGMLGTSVVAVRLALAVG
jgi:hypothetical protein